MKSCHYKNRMLSGRARSEAAQRWTRFSLQSWLRCSLPRTLRS